MWFIFRILVSCYLSMVLGLSALIYNWQGTGIHPVACFGIQIALVAVMVILNRCDQYYHRQCTGRL